MAAIPFLVLLLAFGVAAQTTYSTRDDGCRPGLRHVPEDGVAYRPGETASGWATSQPDADFPAFAPGQFDSLRIDPDLPLADYTANPAFQQHFPFGEIDLGEMDVTGEGGITFNGAPLGNADEGFTPHCR